MAFTTFTSISDAARAVQEFLYDRDAAIPDELREKLKALVGPTTSPVDTVVKGAEFIYARRDQNLAPELMELGAGLALVAQQYNFHGMAEEDRGSKIALAFMRDAKVKKTVGVDYPKKDEDPHVKPEYVLPDTTIVPEPTGLPPAPPPMIHQHVQNITDPDAIIVPEPAGEPTPVEGARRRRARRREQK